MLFMNSPGHIDKRSDFLNKIVNSCPKWLIYSKKYLLIKLIESNKFVNFMGLMLVWTENAGQTSIIWLLTWDVC